MFRALAIQFCFNGAATNWSRRGARKEGETMKLPVLQWGRDQLVAERTIIDEAQREFIPLQWGRDQLVAERYATTAEDKTVDLASMGPRPIGRGELRLS